MKKRGIQSFCLDDSCVFFRHNDVIFREMIDMNENSEKNIFSFRHYISCE